MKVFFGALKDLLDFALEALSGSHLTTKAVIGGDSSNVLYMSAPATRTALLPPTLPRQKSARAYESLASGMAPQRNTVVYAGTSAAPLRKSPEVGVDNIILRIPYGSMLVALETERGWVRSFFHGVEGWVALVDLVDRAAFVYPKFTIGEKNLYDDPNTERVRAVIADEFSYGEGNLPLQAEEYVLYRLYRRGVRPTWGSERPRVPGKWGAMLLAEGNTVAAEEPKQHMIMEWDISPLTSHIAYVEATFPDGSIQISEANWPQDGIYNERMLVKDEWQKLSPRFSVIS